MPTYAYLYNNMSNPLIVTVLQRAQVCHFLNLTYADLYTEMIIMHLQVTIAPTKRGSRGSLPHYPT